MCLVTQSCPTLCDPMDCSLPGFSAHGDSPGKNTGVGSHALLQGIFPTQGSNLGLLYCRQVQCSLSHQASPVIRTAHSRRLKGMLVPRSLGLILNVINRDCLSAYPIPIMPPLPFSCSLSLSLSHTHTHTHT